MENNEHIKKIAELLTISPKQVNQVLDLTAEGNTIPFIARYRKEVTGELDEVQIKAIVDEHDRVIKLTDRKTAVLAKIEERKEAKKAKDFAKADAIRDELLAKGVAIKDTREGVVWELV